MNQDPTQKDELNYANGVRYSIAGDAVKRAIEDLPTEQRELIWWFNGWCRRHDIGRKDLGRILRKKDSNTEFYTSDSIVQLLTGGRIRRGENIEPMLESIAALRRVEETREELKTSGFIETRLFREIEKRCHKALARQRIGYVFGDSQIGKTEAFKEVQRRMGASTVVYVEVPTTGSLGAFLQSLARAFAISERSHNQNGMLERIIESIDSRTLLIVDEAHNCFKSRTSTAGLAIFSFLREVWNRRKCGMMLSFTNEGRDQFLRGPHAKALQQLWRRRITPLQLPNAPGDDDAALFAEAFGLPPAPDDIVAVKVSFVDERGRNASRTHEDNPLRLQREVLASEGLGVWVEILQEASDMAREQRREITWAAVIKAHAMTVADAEMLD